MIKRTDTKEVYQFEHIQHREVKKRQDSIKNISETEKEYLIENEYLTPTDAIYVSVWEIYNEEITKLVRQIPRGNDEAEGRFWKQMGSK